MPIFQVDAQETIYYRVYVEAETEEEAESKVNDMAHYTNEIQECSFPGDNFEIDSVTEVGEAPKYDHVYKAGHDT